MGLLKPTLALVGSSLLGAVASHAPQVADVFSVEWALDSGAGEHLASKEALISQGIPSRLLEELETVSSSPLTFSTGGGLKEASLTIRSQGEVLGDGVIYMLKKCPFVKSLGQLVQQGLTRAPRADATKAFLQALFGCYRRDVCALATRNVASFMDWTLP